MRDTSGGGPTRLASLALVLALGAIGGGGAVALLLPTRVVPAPLVESRRVEEPAPAPPALLREPAREPPSRSEPTVDAPARTPTAEPSDELFSEALRAYARAGIALGWAEVRSSEPPDAVRARLLDEFEREVLALPQALGANAARAQSEVEARARALERGDGIDWLGHLPEVAPELAAVARDPERFAGLFRPQSGGSSVDGTTLGERDPLRSGTVISFPAGVFAVGNLADYRDPFPKDVTLQGNGMDATVLVVSDFGPRGPLERFAVEDCTVFAENGLADVRSGPTVLALRRVRLIGFDCGAGGSYALRLRASAISASQCRFEGGYGRNPEGYANLMRRTSPLVARFDACTFERMSLDGAVQPGVVFSGCAMLDMVDAPGPGPLYEGCRITVLPEEQRWDADVRRRDLNDLFPGWRERLQPR